MVEHPLLQLTALLRPPLAEFRQVHELELTLSQLAALLFLGEAGPQTVSALATRIGLSRAATSHLIERLVRRKLLHRAEDPDDRRQKRVTLARSGERLLHDIRQVHRRSSDALWANLSPADRTRATAHVQALIKLLGDAKAQAAAGQ